MKKIYFLSLWFATFLAFSQTNPYIEITDDQGGYDILVDCDYPVDANRCFDLTAHYTPIYETTSYQVNSIDYATLPNLTAGTVVTSIQADDKWSDVIDLPFDFCFYDQPFHQIIIGDNGIVSFNTALTGGDCQYFAGALPSSSMFTDAIFGVYHDMTNDNNVYGCTDDPATGFNECGEIKTYVVGVAPQRAFVISYENLNHFNCETSRSTSQIVLYETTNIVAVYVHEKPINCEADNNINAYRKNALIGIQNEDGTVATTPVDRNSGVWSANDEAWQFAPNGVSNTLVTWYDEANNQIATGDAITICPEQSTSYSASITYTQCIGAPIVLQDTINVEIDTLYPVAIDNEQIVCDIDVLGEETVDLTSYDTLMVGAQTGLALSYYHSLNDAQTENNPIINPDAYLLQNPTEVIYVRLQRGVACFDVGTLTLQLKEMATSALNTIAVCDDQNDNSESITLTDYTNAILGGQANVTVSYHLTQNDADQNSNPQTTITAANGDSIFVRLTLDPEASCPNVVEIPIVLYTVPVVAPIEVELCSNIAVYDLTQTEAEVDNANTINLTYSYHLYQSWAQNNINPFDPNDANTPIDPAMYELNGVAQIWVRAITANGCIDVYPINFTYIQGVSVSGDQQVSTGTIFDLTNSIPDMVADMTDVTADYYDTLAGAQAQDPAHLIADPANYAITNPDAEAFVVFTNTNSGCITIGTIGLSTVGFGGGGGGGGFMICDIDNDSSEEVILSDYDSSLITGYDDAQYMVVSYFNTDADADANTNPITTISITAPITLYARISLVFEGNELDYIVRPVNLDFQSTTTLTPVTDQICDEFYDNHQYHDLTTYEPLIATAAGVTFSYEYTYGTAINDPENFNVYGPTQVVSVFVTTPDGCTTETTITLTFFDKIETTPATLSACDSDSDGTEEVNLDDALPIVSADYADYEISYYHTLLEAQAGDPATAITTPNNYSITADETVYVRLYDAAITSCYTTEKIDLVLVPVPNILTNSFEYCDYLNDTIETDVALSQYDNAIIGGQQNITISYYTSLNDADNAINAINTVTINQSATVYVRLDAPDMCEKTGAITIDLIDSPTVSDADIVVCDNYTDGSEMYDLTLANSEIVTDPTLYTFQYYLTAQDAFDNTNAIASNYNITNVPQTIHVRVTNNSGCFSLAKINLSFTFPVPVADTELTACDDDFNLSEEFDLADAIPAMLADTTGLTITYYTDEVGAQNQNVNFLVADPSHHNTATESDTIFVRFDDPNTGCFSIGNLVLKVLATPKLVVGNFEICDTDFDGFYTLNLTDLNTIIIQDQTNLDFSYYTDYADAENTVNAITNITNYAIPSDDHTVYIRVVNNFGCWSIAPVTIHIKPSVNTLQINDILESCDDDNDDYGIFDLATFAQTHPFSNEAGATYRYFNTEADANLEQNEIPDPSAHQNATAISQTIYVRVAAPDKCDAITSFTIQVRHIAVPTLTSISFCSGDTAVLDIGAYASYLWSTGETTQTIAVTTPGVYSVQLVDDFGCTGTFDVHVIENPLPDAFPIAKIECDYEGAADNIMTFDLHSYDNELTGNSTTVTTHFYLNQADFDADQNELANDFVNTANPQTILVKIVDNTTFCFSETTLELEASSIQSDAATLELCDEIGSEDGIGAFDLTLATPQVLTNLPANTVVSYFETANDAETETAALGTTYTNTTTYNQIIYSRVENANGCVSIQPVNLIVNQLPDILPDEEKVYCLNIYPETITLVSGVSNENDFTYLWNTGETTPTIQINEIGTYNVVATTIATGCNKSRNITVFPSSIAVIESIEILDAQNVNEVIVYVSGDGDYEYAIDDEFGNYQDSNHFYNVSGGLHTLYVRDKNTCGTVLGYVTGISTSKFFTPNNDDYNDTWMPIGFSNDLHKDISVYLFDRYGKLIMKLDPFGSGWDGFYNNKMMPQDDYWYRIEYDERFSGKHRLLKGHFALKLN